MNLYLETSAVLRDLFDGAGRRGSASCYAAPSSSPPPDSRSPRRDASWRAFGSRRQRWRPPLHRGRPPSPRRVISGRSLRSTRTCLHAALAPSPWSPCERSTRSTSPRWKSCRAAFPAWSWCRPTIGCVPTQEHWVSRSRRSHGAALPAGHGPTPAERRATLTPPATAAGPASGRADP